jgi:hypothetical protein
LCDQPWLDHPLKYIRATQRWKAKNQRAEAEALALVTTQDEIEEKQPDSTE